MIDADLSRGVVNHRMARLRRIFKWAVSEEFVPPSVHQALATVEGLPKGRTDFRECQPVGPGRVKWSKRPWVDAPRGALTHCNPNRKRGTCRWPHHLAHAHSGYFVSSRRLIVGDHLPPLCNSPENRLSAPRPSSPLAYAIYETPLSPILHHDDA